MENIFLQVDFGGALCERCISIQKAPLFNKSSFSSQRPALRKQHFYPKAAPLYERPSCSGHFTKDVFLFKRSTFFNKMPPSSGNFTKDVFLFKKRPCLTKAAFLHSGLLYESSISIQKQPLFTKGPFRKKIPLLLIQFSHCSLYHADNFFTSIF